MTHVIKEKIVHAEVVKPEPAIRSVDDAMNLRMDPLGYIIAAIAAKLEKNK